MHEATALVFALGLLLLVVDQVRRE